MQRRRKTFTLLELLATVVIMGIIVTIMIPSWRKAVIHQRDTEAQEMLKAIKQAEEMHKLQFGSYVMCFSANNCNSLLPLDLPEADMLWDYTVVPEGASGFCSQASTMAGNTPARSWHIRSGYHDNEAQPGGC